MGCKEALENFERLWLEDKRRWEREKGALLERLDEQAKEILELKYKLGKADSETRTRFQDQLELCQHGLKELEAARAQCERALEQARRQLETLSQPALGEGFFRHFAEAIELWDWKLIEEARQVGGTSLEPWLRAIWKEREEALSRVLSGETIDWCRVRTGLVLEWALLAWLEGIRDG